MPTPPAAVNGVTVAGGAEEAGAVGAGTGPGRCPWLAAFDPLAVAVTIGAGFALYAPTFPWPSRLPIGALTMPRVSWSAVGAAPPPGKTAKARPPAAPASSAVNASRRHGGRRTARAERWLCLPDSDTLSIVANTCPDIGRQGLLEPP